MTVDRRQMLVGFAASAALSGGVVPRGAFAASAMPAPAELQEAINSFGRPAHDALIADNLLETPLDAKPMVTAFQIWDRTIGAGKG